MNVLNALAAGNFSAVIDGILSDDRIEGDMPCPCGQVNRVIVVRTGCVVIMWADMAEKHGSPVDPCFDVTSYRSVAHAIETMDALRRDMEQLNGMAQLINAVNGAVSGGGDFMVI